MNERILIVEDEADVVSLLRALLEDEGYTCFDISSGEGVLDFLDNQTVDIILLDIILPGVDGYEVCKMLKMRRQTNLIPIIMLTAKAFHEDMIKGLSVGADRYITKPFEHNELLNAIKEQCLSKKKLLDKGVVGNVEFHIQSDLKYLDQINNLMYGLFKYTKLNEKEINDLRYVILEVGKNAIEWGNKKRKSLPIHIHYTIETDRLTLIVRDHGSGFDFKKYLDSSYNPTGENNIRETTGKRSGGLGIMLARIFMDEIKYNEQGNETTLIKYY